MRKRRVLLAVGLLSAALPFTLGSGPAKAAGSGTDPTGDTVDRAVGCYRAAPPTTCALDPAASPGHNQFDITGYGMSGSGGHYDFSLDVAAAWPAEGALPTALPGVTVLEVRWVFRAASANTAKTIGQNCAGQKPGTDVGTTPVRPVTFDHNYCQDYREGPFPASDGYSYFYGLTAKVANGVWHYDWEAGWYEGLTQIFYSNSGENTHDQQSPDKGVIGGKGTTHLTLHAPMLFRADIAEDGDPTTPQPITHVFGTPGGDTISGVTAATYGQAEVTVPERPVCPAKPGEPTEPVFRNLPPPLNDKDNCVQQSVGVTFVADWAPGDPRGTTPNYGGFIPRLFPRALSYTVGTGTPFCPYPAGLAALNPEAMYMPRMLDTGAQPLPGGGAVSVVQPANGFTVMSLHTPDNHVSPIHVGLPIAQERACGNTQLGAIGMFFTDASGAFAVS